MSRTLDNRNLRKKTQIRLPDLKPETVRGAIAVAVQLANFGYVGGGDDLKKFERFSDLYYRVAPTFQLPPGLLRITMCGVESAHISDSEVTELRGWLTSIIEQRNVALKVRQEVAARLKESVRVASPHLVFEGGEPRIDGGVEFHGPRALVAFATMSLVSKDADRLAKRLGRCKRCGLFFFDLKDADSGRPRSFCSESHKNQWTQWRYKNKDKDKKEWKVPPLPYVGDDPAALRALLERLAVMSGRDPEEVRAQLDKALPKFDPIPKEK